MKKESALMVSAAVGGGTVSGSAVVIWIFQCIAAGKIVTPDQITATAIASFVFPMLYAVRDAWISRYASLPDPGTVVSSAPTQTP